MCEEKQCCHCKEWFPATSEYFCVDNRLSSGLTGRCRECKKIIGGLPVAREGYKICVKCGKELPATDKYFHKHSRHIDGLRSDCKDCRRSDRVKKRENSSSPKDEKVKKTTVWNRGDREGFRTCTMCGQEKPLEDYNNQAKGYLGKRAHCRECQNETNRQYKHSDRGREKNKEWKRTQKGKICTQKYRDKPETKEKRKRNSNKEDAKLRRKIYRASDWYKMLKRLANQRRKALKRQLPATLTADDWLYVKQEFGNRCCYCGEAPDVMSQDHFIPVTKYGEYVMGNVLPACMRCNTSKLNHDFFKWYPKQPYYSKLREKRILKFVNKFNIIEQRVLF